MTEPVTITDEQLRTWLLAEPPSRIPTLLEAFTATDRKRLQAVLKTWRTELRTLQMTNWGAADRQGKVVSVAGVASADTPAQAASWLGNRTAIFWFCGAIDRDERLKLLADRHDAAWIADLAVRLANKLREGDDHDHWRFVNDLAACSGAELPITSGFMNGWVTEIGTLRYELNRQGLDTPTTKDWLRRQPQLRERVEGIFTTDGIGSHIHVYGATNLTDHHWPKALADLATEGVLDRAELLDACLARLLRGDRTLSLRGYVDVFEALTPTPDEVRDRRGTYLSMATTAAGTVAKLAQQALRALDTTEPTDPTDPLTPMDLADLTAAMLSRPETGLANAQIAWLDAAIKRDPSTASILLPALANAFAHPATTVQQRALKLLTKHLKHANAAAISELRDIALSIDPALKADADALFATFATFATHEAEPPSESLSPIPLPEYQPTALPPMPGSPEELVTALAPSYAGGEIGPIEAEQIMAAVAVLSHRDRPALAAAFQPLYDRYTGPMYESVRPIHQWQFPDALRCLFEAVLGKDHRAGRVRPHDVINSNPRAAIVLRIQEFTDHLLHRGTLPCLLATPTAANGTLDPAVLEQRRATYRELNIKPLPIDLEHAQLRSAPNPIRDKFFAELPLGEPFATDAALGKATPAPPFWEASPRRKRLFGYKPTIALDEFLFLPDLAKDGTLDFPQPSIWENDQQFEFASVMLPYDPDVVAAYALTRLHNQANGHTSRIAPARVFPALAETAGTPGPLTHLALVYALASDLTGSRIAAQDAALILASRNLLHPHQLGRLAAIAWQRDLVRGKRLIESLTQLDQAGASADVFATTAAMLGVLSKTPEIRNLPDLLLLATRAAVSAGLTGVAVPGLTELATTTKPKRVGAEARRLLEAIATPI